MRNFSLYFVVIIVGSLLVSTTAKSQLQKIYLHPKASGSGKQSQFVDSVRFIPLEIKESINIGAYNNVQVTDKYFLLVDYPDKTLFLYAKDGRFIKKINYKKLGENFYPAYHEQSNKIVFLGNNKNYALTPKDEIKIKLDWNNPRNKKYFKKYFIDLADTSFTIQKGIPNENDIVKAYPFYDDYSLGGQIITSPLYKDSLDYELKIYKNNELVNSFFPYNRINEPRFLFTQENVSFNKTDTPGIHFINRPYCDTIYKMIGDSIFPAYHLVLPLENSLPPSFFTRPFRNKTERDNFGNNNGWMFNQVYSFYETPRHLILFIGYFNNYESYIYLKQTNVTYKTKNIKPDSSQYNVQLLADLNLQRNGDWLFKLQKAGDLVAFFKQNKNVAIPKELESFIQNNPHGNAPVIVQFKLKN